MTTIDQRILIPAPPDTVWEYLSDIAHNPNWQADCQNVQFLSSKRQGVGTRWRTDLERGRDTVTEITSWYNGLGYEYVHIDGVNYKENKGRLRLQEIAEGTVVQWTFTFEVGGLLSGVRGGTRQLENTMANSLKALYKEIKQYNQSGSFAAKSLMRDAPGVEARQHYKPRHPSPTQEDDEGEALAVQPLTFEEPPTVAGDALFMPPTDLVIDEPPIAEEDTRPNPAVVSDGVTVEPLTLSTALPLEPAAEPVDEVIEGEIVEGEFIEIMDVVPVSEAEEDETVVPITISDVLPNALKTNPPELETAIEVGEPVSTPEAVVESVAAPAPVEQIDSKTEAPSNVIPEDEFVQAAPLPDAESIEAAIGERPGLSIWDVFGVPRPSQTQEVEAATPPPPPAPPADLEAPRRQGMRVTIRRRMVKVRYPQ